MKALYPFNGLKSVTSAHAVTIQRNKKILSFFLSFIFFFSFLPLRAQFIPGNPGQFGIDGDLYTEQRLSGSFNPVGSHDWFKTSNGTGLAVFDTLNAAKIREQIALGKNYTFARKMQYGAYTIHGGYLMLDGTYSRDYFGNDTTLDKTIFSTGRTTTCHNAQDPTKWTTNDKGDVLPSKTDIIDSYIHMRRQGTSVEIGNASPLLVYLGASTLSTSGDHFIDFELFKTPVKYSGGKFSQTSLSTTSGGRDPWTFNADGSVKTFGGMAFSFSFNSGAVTDISIYIWVHYSVYTSVNPLRFDFAKGGEDWNGVDPKGGYGFARIVPNNGEALPAWGAPNSLPVQAPVWGTNNKEFGSQINNYYFTQYTPGQFAEAAINLSALGVDPAFSADFDKCTPPYRRVIIKTRSSSSFSSALQDFAGPFEFLDAPTIPATISNPGAINCTNSSITLSAAHPIVGANYLWKDDAGNIISNGSNPSITVNKTGKYVLTASLYEGCTPTTEKSEVVQDFYPPFATAFVEGLLTGATPAPVTLRGGNEDSSNYLTPFGGSKGLMWNWSGPDSFSATTKDATTNKEGTYQLIVTEVRNGCKDTAFVSLSRTEAIVLSVKLKSFAARNNNGRMDLGWKVAENENIKQFEVQRSLDGINFGIAATVFTSEKQGDEEYQFHERINASRVYYRLKMVDNQAKVSYSNIAVISSETDSPSALTLLRNPVMNDLLGHYYSDENGTVIVNVYNQAGVLVYSKRENKVRGVNYLAVSESYLKGKGSYVIEVVSGHSQKLFAKFIKL